MTVLRMFKYAGNYPNVAHRAAGWHTALIDIPRVPLDGAWTRDIPAARLRRTTLLAAPKLLEPVGHLYTHNRYTRKNGFPSLYLSDGVSTAAAEVFGADAVKRGPLGTPDRNRLSLRVTAHLPDVVDLTDEDVRSRLAVTLDELTEPVRPLEVDFLNRFPGYELPQCLGELSNDLGVGAIRYPSAPATNAGLSGSNIVIFVDNLATTGGWYEAEEPVSGQIERWPPV